MRHAHRALLAAALTTAGAAAGVVASLHIAEAADRRASARRERWLNDMELFAGLAAYRPRIVIPESRDLDLIYTGPGDEDASPRGGFKH